MTDGDGMYALGIDLGTTFSAAAVWRAGHAEIVELGSKAAAIPSVVLLREDASVLTGDAANRRATSEPHRVAREFKRRIGDTTPLLLGGTPYSAEALTARLLKAIMEQVVSAEGGPPAALVLSHPANWGPYKTDLLAQAVRIADVQVPVSYVTEPEAAAVLYASQQRVPAGSVVAVYDLGGGTFDAAVLRRTHDGFEVLGTPEGIERLGGVDVDAAVVDHVTRALGGKLEELDEDDPAAASAVARLRVECVDAKEALSSDTDVSIPVILPNVSTDVRLTRNELEAMVRPALQDTIDALRRALRSAEIAPEDLESVLLVGGASRMPLVGQLVGAEIGRPVAIDAHPKHSVALGAAWLAAVAAGAVEPLRASVDHQQDTGVISPVPLVVPTADAAVATAVPIPAQRTEEVPAALPVAAVAAAAPLAVPAPVGGGGQSTALLDGGTGELPVPQPRFSRDTTTQVLSPGAPPARSRPDFVAASSAAAAGEKRQTRRRILLGTAIAVVAAGGIALAAPKIFDVTPTGNASPAAPVVATPTTTVTPTTTTTTVVPTTTEAPAPAPAPQTHAARKTTRATRQAQRPAPAPVRRAPVAPPQVETITREITKTVKPEPRDDPQPVDPQPVDPQPVDPQPVDPTGDGQTTPDQGSEGSSTN